MRTVDVSPDPATLPQAGRVSSVDHLPESPGYEPITMHGLWQIADAACTVINAARSHLISHPYFSENQEAFDLLGDAFIGLHAVCTYTCILREVTK